MTYLPIMHRPAFEAFVLSLPAATLVRQWRDDSVAKVGEKIFCLLDRDPGEIWLKVSDMSYDLLTEMDGIRPPPISPAPAGWRSATKARSERMMFEPISPKRIASWRKNSARSCAPSWVSAIRA